MLVHDNWKRDVDVPTALDLLKNKLLLWNVYDFWNIHRKKDRLLARIQGVQYALETRLNQGLLDLDTSLQQELDSILAREETLRFQKSREQWNCFGDRNTKFFHTTTLVRRNRNKIVCLKGDDGVWSSNQQHLQANALRFFSHLYSDDNPTADLPGLIVNDFPDLSTEELCLLTKEVLEEEVFRAVK